MPKEPFNYKRYLASREWGFRKEAIRERSNNRCEHCRWFPMTEVHHLSYEHIGHEPFDELLAVCRYCHEYLSGRVHVDLRDVIDWWYILQFLKPEELKERMSNFWLDRVYEKYGCEYLERLEETRKQFTDLLFEKEEQG